jgi:hypothetical protein
VEAATVINIVNADISASAAIADTKLAQITTVGKVLPAAVDGTAVITTDPRLSNARTPTTHTHDASQITAGTLDNARTTASSSSTNNAIVARDASGNFSASRITSSNTIPKGGSLIFSDTYGTDFEFRGNSVDDKLYVRASGLDILEIDATTGVPIWKLTSLSSSFRVGIGTTAPSAAAKVEISSTTQGFLPPRMTEVQRNAIASPPVGLVLYNTTTDKLQVRTSTLWADLH